MNTEQKRGFRFEDIVLFDDRAIQKVLREIEWDDLAAVLNGMDAEALE